MTRSKLGEWGDEELVLVSEGAAWLGCTVSAYYKMAQRGVAPRPIKFGKASRLLAKELKAMKDEALSRRNEEMASL